MKRAVVWSHPASRDFLKLTTYISTDSPDAALRIGAAITQTAAKLGTHLTGRPGRLARVFEKSVPKLPYIIAYEIAAKGDEEIVVILQVVHSARNWPKGAWPES